ncbi:winged helix-turn-helix domain-containing protein [Paraburkholderia sp. XV]|uniref:winged helix-turn-helix domain-containing protein n=1 Tax=Paraburkholderia sp. XV TaxID=2831520 RepID=UPI0039905D46
MPTALVDIEENRGTRIRCGRLLRQTLESPELLARQSVPGRCTRQPSAMKLHTQARMIFGHFVLDLLSRTPSHEDRLFRLSEREVTLITIFAAAPMHVFTRQNLIRLPRLREDSGVASGADVPECRVRHLFETEPSLPRLIQTVRGRGYVFVLEEKQMPSFRRTVHRDDCSVGNSISTIRRTPPVPFVIRNVPATRRWRARRQQTRHLRQFLNRQERVAFLHWRCRVHTTLTPL